MPEKSPFGRFEDQFVQQRRLGLEKCINKTANHPVLAKDADLRLFLESDSFALDVSRRNGLEACGLTKLVRSSIEKQKSHPREVVSWHLSEIPSLDQDLPNLMK